MLGQCRQLSGISLPLYSYFNMENRSTDKNQLIVLFDGNCGLCNRSVRFVLKHEKNNELYFSALQSELGKQYLKQFDLENKTNSIVFIKNGKAFIKSGGALRLTKYLKGLWPLLYCFIIVPKFIRDAVYDYIAKNRIKWYGTADYCEMMTPDLKKDF